MVNVLIHKKEEKGLKLFPKKDAEKIFWTIDLLKQNPFHPLLSIKKLDLPFEAWRVRVGVYRMLFTFNGDTLFIYKIRHRKDAYKNK